MQHQSIRVVRSAQFDSATAQTPGSQRFAAVHAGAGIESPMWGGLFSVEPGARTGIHHHGEQHTIAYVLSGYSYVRWGDRGEFDAILQAGDFLYVPAWLPHQEINPSSDASFQWIVVRSTSEPVVVNLHDDFWDDINLSPTHLRVDD
ncbi:cupin domain-containing protein [Tunturiibacter gelidoferens]|uniref:Cupin domain-containing protein n=1 Tax=Tunturiibacter gelidiferens TaxID=3069689 RepID=A0AAU7YWE7_9BACT